MSYQNWETQKIFEGDEIFLVKVNTEIADTLFERKLILKMKNGYPWVVRPASSACSSCGSSPCPHGKPEKFLMALHVFVWIEKNGLMLPDPEGRQRSIHHKNEEKLDARIKNLAVGTQAAHALHHNSKRRKHSQRKRFNSAGLYRPHQPAQVVEVTEEEKKKILPSKKSNTGPTLFDEIRALEKVLEDNFDEVLKDTAHLEGQGRSIPRSAPVSEWRSPKTRLMGLRMPRMACSKAEACFVRVYASHDLDLARVAEVLDVRQALLHHLLRRVPVAVAVERWVKHRRLPTKTAAFGFEEVKLQPGRRRKNVVVPTARKPKGE